MSNITKYSIWKKEIKRWLNTNQKHSNIERTRFVLQGDLSRSVIKQNFKLASFHIKNPL